MRSCLNAQCWGTERVEVQRGGPAVAANSTRRRTTSCSANSGRSERKMKDRRRGVNGKREKELSWLTVVDACVSLLETGTSQRKEKRRKREGKTRGREGRRLILILCMYYAHVCSLAFHSAYCMCIYVRWLRSN